MSHTRIALTALTALSLIVLVVVDTPGTATDETAKRPGNRLAKETSPYLLMHAHNPVDWYPWGPEAFAKAKKEGKLVFLSIGYSSCYWCHVMERESFQNADVAKLMNQLFVCVKVDREERPDVDAIYMTALNVLGQRGGWPLSMFLTADAKPIIGGTYWPTEDRTVEGQKIRGFKSIMQFMRDWHAEKPGEVTDQADTLAEQASKTLSGQLRGIAIVPLERSLVVAAVDGLKGEFDPVHGGFGSPDRNFKGTKFPVPPSLSFVLSEARRSPAPELTNLVTMTLDHMAQGGIYDQVGGGFHRYGTERTWTIPHFEKMLYDNAQLVELYARAFQLTRLPLYERIVRETLEFVRREMTSPEGAFLSALDAETQGEEGRYYVWTPKELQDAIGNPADLAFIQRVYGADAGVNFEEKYHILKHPRARNDIARDLGITRQALDERLEPLRKKLFAVRSRRQRPFLDTKVITSWNGQMIAGYAVAGEVLSDKAYIESATKAAEFVLKNLRTTDGRLLRTYGAQPGKVAEAKLNGYLDDYAYLVYGLLRIHDATKDSRWLDEARSLTDMMVNSFSDDERGGFFYTSNDHEKLFARSKDQHDGVQPSGNSTAAVNLVHLWKKTGDDRYRTLAEKSIGTFAGSIKANPTSLPTMAQALALFLDVREPATQEEIGKGQAEKGGGAKKSENLVKVKAEAGKIGADDRQVVTFTLSIEEGWHLYANPVPEDFPGIPVTVTVDAKTKPKDVQVEYPKGTLVKDALTGDYRIYEKEAKIKVSIQREKGDTGPLEFSVKVQTCNKQTCLLPGVVKVKVP